MIKLFYGFDTQTKYFQALKDAFDMCMMFFMKVMPK